MEEFKCIMQSERSQAPKATDCMIPFTLHYVIYRIFIILYILGKTKL